MWNRPLPRGLPSGSRGDGHAFERFYETNRRFGFHPSARGAAPRPSPFGLCRGLDSRPVPAHADGDPALSDTDDAAASSDRIHPPATSEQHGEPTTNLSVPDGLTAAVSDPVSVSRRCRSTGGRRRRRVLRRRPTGGEGHRWQSGVGDLDRLDRRRHRANHPLGLPSGAGRFCLTPPASLRRSSCPPGSAFVPVSRRRGPRNGARRGRSGCRRRRSGRPQRLECSTSRL